MRSIPFYDVINRNMSLQGYPEISKISFGTVNNNLTLNNLLLFTESKTDDMTTHCNRCIRLYDQLLETTDISEQDKNNINRSIFSGLEKVSNLDSINQTISSTKNINKDLFFEFVDKLDNCDRVIRNEERILKRFNLNKIIKENIGHGCRHTVYELCSLIDTYDISPKAKLNIALENVSFALYKSGHRLDINEVTQYITEYFLTRDAVITDKQYDGYVHVLEHNRFIDPSIDSISYIFEAKKTKGNSYKDKANALINQCEGKKCKSHMKQILSIKNEKQASKYIDDSVEMIIDEAIPKTDSLLLLKSIYSLPLIGNVSSEFVNYKVEMSKNKVKIKNKLANMENTNLIKSVLDDGSLLECAELVSDNIYFENYILDDGYKEETNIINILESSNDENVKKIIDSFKASNEKSPSKFRNMISRIMTKSPENIIEGTPSIFSAVRIMLYLAVAGAFPLGPVFAALLALVDKFVSMRMDEKQAEKMLKHFKSEKEKAEKKLEKLSGKEKENQEEYIKCLDKCIKKVKDFLSKIDDENEELSGSNEDDFDFGDDDFNFESAVMESGTILNDSVSDEILSMIDESTNLEVLQELSVLFDNCPDHICNQFYDKIVDIKAPLGIQYHKNMNKVTTESSFIVEYEAMQTLEEILNEAKKEDKKKEVKKDKKEFKNPLNKVSQFVKPKDKPKDGKHDKFDLATLKMAVVNFKQKFKDLRGKEQELWRNIDIATSQLSNGIQKALTSDRREAIIKGSIIPSFSKCIKFAISVGAIGAFTGPVGAAISAVGMLGASKALNERERRLLYDEIDTELQVVDKQIQLAENEGNMNQYRFLLNYQKKLIREKQRIKYNIRVSGRSLPEAKRGGDK